MDKMMDMLEEDDDVQNESDNSFMNVFTGEVVDSFETLKMLLS